MGSWSERTISHTGTETLPRLLRGCSRESSAMRESVAEQCRVQDDGLRVVNCCHRGRIMTVPGEEATANYVPAAAVTRRWRALFGFIGRKGSAGGLLSLM